MNGEELKICKRCLLRDMEEADKLNIKKYQDAIKEADKVSASLYESRLTICKACDYLNAGTCNACGCYVELRALSSLSRCPHRHW